MATNPRQKRGSSPSPAIDEKDEKTLQLPPDRLFNMLACTTPYQTKLLEKVATLVLGNPWQNSQDSNLKDRCRKFLAKWPAKQPVDFQAWIQSKITRLGELRKFLYEAETGQPYEQAPPSYFQGLFKEIVASVINHPKKIVVFISVTKETPDKAELEQYLNNIFELFPDMQIEFVLGDTLQRWNGLFAPFHHNEEIIGKLKDAFVNLVDYNDYPKLAKELAAVLYETTKRFGATWNEVLRELIQGRSAKITHWDEFFARIRRFVQKETHIVKDEKNAGCPDLSTLQDYESLADNRPKLIQFAQKFINSKKQELSALTEKLIEGTNTDEQDEATLKAILRGNVRKKVNLLALEAATRGYGAEEFLIFINKLFDNAPLAFVYFGTSLPSWASDSYMLNEDNQSLPQGLPILCFKKCRKQPDPPHLSLDHLSESGVRTSTDSCPEREPPSPAPTTARNSSVYASRESSPSLSPSTSPARTPSPPLSGASHGVATGSLSPAVAPLSSPQKWVNRLAGAVGAVLAITDECDPDNADRIDLYQVAEQVARGMGFNKKPPSRGSSPQRQQRRREHHSPPRAAAPPLTLLFNSAPPPQAAGAAAAANLSPAAAAAPASS